MKLPDLDKLRSEKSLSSSDFLKCYNENLPVQFPRVSSALLKEFKKSHETLFKRDDVWSLDLHRKKVMDWLTARSRSSNSTL